MANIVQKAVQNETDDDSFGMTDAEKEQLLGEIKKFGKDKK